MIEGWNSREACNPGCCGHRTKNVGAWMGPHKHEEELAAVDVVDCMGKGAWKNELSLTAQTEQKA
jgi:hypothetical protein